MTTMGGVSHPVHDGHRHAAFIKCVASNNIFVAEHSRRPVKGALIVQGDSAQGPSRYEGARRIPCQCPGNPPSAPAQRLKDDAAPAEVCEHLAINMHL